MLKISRDPNGQPEIFFSIQGEGANIGRPAIFLRLAYCNLRCTWCDTKYTWDWQADDSPQKIVELSAALAEEQVLKYACQYLVVTGGEPLIQQKDLSPLLERLQNKGFYIEIETNGTLIPDEKLLDQVDHWSVSPKLRSSGNPETLRSIPECYRLFAYINSSHFKFVVRDNEDLQELLDLSYKYNIPSEKIILMPESQNGDDLLEKSRWLVEVCKANCFRFSFRLHTLLWGNTRGK